MAGELSAHERDTLRDLITVGIDRAAEVLGRMVSDEVSLSIPDVRLGAAAGTALTARSTACTVVELPFDGVLRGAAALVLPGPDTSRLVEVFGVRPDAGDESDALRLSVLAEVGNVVLNHVVGALGDALDTTVAFEPPRCVEDVRDVPSVVFGRRDPDVEVLVADAHVAIAGRRIDGDVVVVCEAGVIARLVEAGDHAATRDGTIPIGPYLERSIRT